MWRARRPWSEKHHSAGVRYAADSVIPARDELSGLRRRVNALEESVQKLSTLRQPTSPPAVAPTPQARSWSADLASLEGNSSFRKQAILTADIAQIKLQRHHHSPEVEERLADLQNSLQCRNVQGDLNPVRAQDVLSLKEKLPPSDFVVSLLQAATRTCSHH